MRIQHNPAIIACIAGMSGTEIAMRRLLAAVLSPPGFSTWRFNSGRRAMNIMRLVAVLVAVGPIGGCGYGLTLMAADGTMGTGHATGFSGNGTLDVQIGNRSYTGTWVAAQGGSSGFGIVGRTSFSTMSVDASSTGNAMLRSADGSSLRCKFVFGGMSGTGFGECLDSAGTHYDLQIIE
jgi:hypothetical protein